MVSIPDDTIAAISSPPGRGAVGMIRISGNAVKEILEKLTLPVSKTSTTNFDNRFIPRKSILSKFINHAGDLIDTGILCFYPGPRSYTGEDTAEMFLHGNPILLKQYLMEIISVAGVRPAQPGEFTKRAYINGRMDLTEAEAVKRVIDARSEFELMAGRKMLSGDLSRIVNRFRSSMINLKADTEAEVDFSDEDLTYESRELRKKHIADLIKEIDKILSSSDATMRVVAGYQIAIAGIPNAGKSTLLNKLLGYDRAIVSNIAGTTRDYLSEETTMEGISVRFVDTAGLRESDDLVEREGIKRSRKEIDQSNLILHIIDGSIPLYKSSIIGKADRIINVIHKTDILHNDWKNRQYPEGENVYVSSKTDEGIEELKHIILNHLTDGDYDIDPMIIEERHRYHFNKIKESLSKVPDLWESNAPDEIVAMEINEALDHLGDITGRVDTEEVLGRIFSRFCVGK